MALSADKKRLSIESGSGITPWEVAQCIGDYRTTKLGRNVGLLCSSTQVNKGAKRKPIEAVSNQYGVQTDDQRKQAAGGFYGGTNNKPSQAPFATSASGILVKAIENGGKGKTVPLTIYRLGDFDGYYHDAARPYNYYTLNEDYDPNKRMYIKNILNDENIQIRLSDMPEIDGYHDPISNGNIVFVYIDGNGAVRTIDTGVTVGELHDSGNGSEDVSTYVDVSLNAITDNSIKKYDYVGAATNESFADTNEITGLYFPDSLKQMITRKALLISYSVFDGSSFNIYSTNNEYINKTDITTLIHYLQLSIEADSSYEFPIKIEYKLTCWNSDDATGQEHIFENTQTVNTFEVLTRKYPIGDYVDATSRNLKLTLDVVVSKSDNIPLSTQHFNFITGNLENGVANKSNAPTVYNILNNGVL